MRLCSLHSIDLKDIDEKENGPYIKLRNRPETGAKLKHGSKSERKVALDPRVITLLATPSAGSKPTGPTLVGGITTRSPSSIRSTGPRGRPPTRAMHTATPLSYHYFPPRKPVRKRPEETG